MSYRRFTVQEANELLPRLREVLRKIHRIRDEARHHHEKLQLLDALWGEELARPENPDHAEYVERRAAIVEAERVVRATVEAEIRDRGIRFPAGGIEHGLLDFPSSYGGRWIYLCWRLGETKVAYWHEVDAGFQGRQRITAEQAAAMGRADDPEELDDSVLDL